MKEFYVDLLKQIKEKEYKPLRFTIYNYIEDDGYVSEISALKGKKYEIEDFEYVSLDIPEADKIAIKSENTNVLNRYYSFSYYVEHTCQTLPECMVFVMKDLGIVFAVKPKNFDVNDLKVA